MGMPCYKRLIRLTSLAKTGKSDFISEYPFSGKLFCQNCGSKFTRRQGELDKHHVWQCINNMQNGTEACPQKSVKERMLEQAFVRAMNKVIGGKDAFMEKLLANIDKCLSEKVYDFSLEEIDEKVSSEIELFRERRQRLKRAKSTRTIPVVICFNTLFLRSY